MACKVGLFLTKAGRVGRKHRQTDRQAVRHNRSPARAELLRFVSHPHTPPTFSTKDATEENKQLHFRQMSPTLHLSDSASGAKLTGTFWRRCA